eukprot:12897848-Prorocentrum_lima.AAC.1
MTLKMSGVSSSTTPRRMLPTVTGQVRATGNGVIFAAWNKAKVTCPSFSKTVFGVTGAPEMLRNSMPTTTIA